MSLKFLLLLCLPIGTVYCYFDVELTEGRYLNGTGEVRFDEIKVKRVNKTLYGISGKLEVSEEIDDSFEVLILIFYLTLIFLNLLVAVYNQVTESFFKKQGNEYRLTPFHIGPYKFCDYIQNQSFTYDDFLKCSDLPPKKDCPWKKGTYNMNKCLLPVDKMPHYFNGEYRIDIVASKNGEVSGGFQAFFYVIKDDS